MRIQALFDHQVRVHRPTESKGALRDITKTYTAVGAAPTTPNAAIVPPKLRLTDYGPGEQAAGSLEAYMAAGADVQADDVLDVTSGPEAPVKLRVLSATRPRGHHTELQLEPWEGSLA